MSGELRQGKEFPVGWGAQAQALIDGEGPNNTHPQDVALRLNFASRKAHLVAFTEQGEALIRAYLKGPEVE